MKSSARNHYTGTVSRVSKGAVNDEVELELPGGQKIVAVITRQSADALGLAPGVPAFALIKASSVIVLADTEGARFSARNCLQGRVADVQPGAVNSEVVIELPNGVRVTAIVTMESAKLLDLKKGMTASALFKASSVIIGVPG